MLWIKNPTLYRLLLIFLRFNFSRRDHLTPKRTRLKSKFLLVYLTSAWIRIYFLIRQSDGSKVGVRNYLNSSVVRGAFKSKRKIQLLFRNSLVLGYWIVVFGLFLFPSWKEILFSQKYTNKMIKFKIKHSTLLMKNYWYWKLSSKLCFTKQNVVRLNQLPLCRSYIIGKLQKNTSPIWKISFLSMLHRKHIGRR